MDDSRNLCYPEKKGLARVTQRPLEGEKKEPSFSLSSCNSETLNQLSESPFSSI
jgi:hypothetical protein